MISRETYFDGRIRRGKLKSYDWSVFQRDVGERESTMSFIEGEFPSTEWLKRLTSKETIKTARGLLKSFGVAGTRRRGMIWMNKPF